MSRHEREIASLRAELERREAVVQALSRQEAERSRIATARIVGEAGKLAAVIDQLKALGAWEPTPTRSRP